MIRYVFLTGEVPTAIVSHILAYILVGASAAVFGFYAIRNTRFAWLEPNSRRWLYLALAGGAGTIFGVAGVADEFATGSFATWAVLFKHGGLLFFTVFLAFAMREVYYKSIYAPVEEQQVVSHATARRVENVLLGLVILTWWGSVFTGGHHTFVESIETAGLIFFALYGIGFGLRVGFRAKGSTLDRLLRHLIPIMVCVGIIGVGRVSRLAGIPEAYVWGLMDVLTIVAATLLFTATIGLKRNLEAVTFGRETQPVALDGGER